MRFISLAFLVLIYFQKTNAQNATLDKLFLQLKSVKTDIERVNLYNNISAEARVSKVDTAIYFAKEAIALATKIDYPVGIVNGNIRLSHAYSLKGKFTLSLEYTKKAAALATSLKNDSLIVYCFLSEAGYHYNTSNYDQGIELALKALKYFESQKHTLGIIKSKSLMSQIYQLKNDLPKAEKLLQETISLFAKVDDARMKASTMHTLANVYGMQEKYAEALKLDKEGLALCSKENMTFLTSQFYDNMANCYMYSGKYDSATKYFNICLSIDSAFDSKKQMSDTYLNLGNMALMQKKFIEAEKHFLTSIELSTASGYKQGKYEALNLLAETYNQSNKHNEAIITLKKAYKVKDSIINEKSENKLIELETVYETEKKEQQLKLQQVKISRKNYLIGGLGIAALSLILFGFTFYKKREAQNKLALQKEVLHQQEIATKAVLEAEEKERQRIARDLHDGVGQVMSAAKMNLSAFENELNFKDEHQKMQFEKVINLVDEGCKEVRHVSHQMMPNALLKAGLSSAIKEFIDKIDSKTLKVNLYTEGLNERLDNNIETVLYRVIQECVNNVIKHSGANILEISLIKDIDGISATVEDNGKGFDSKANINNEGIGLKNIRTRIEYLKGTVEFDSTEGKGTLVAIHVPVV
jgi:two-component system NarL family sensor kinase